MVQAAVGARADATLYPVHFNDAGLNSLGREKLELMLEDEEATQPLVVYLDLPDGADAAPAHKAVADFLKARGLTESQMKVVDSPNPKTLHPAADALTGLTALQQTQPNANPAAAPAGQVSQQQQPSAYSPTATPDMNH
jgi:hypothetical protein